MALQYDPTTNKLLYINYPSALGANLQAECWCGDDNIWFTACCMPNTGDPLYPQYVIISRTKWNALSTPSCVFYKSCLYCLEFPVYPEYQYTGCAVNVDEDDVITSSYTSCSDSWPTSGCSTCLVCTPCTDAQTPSFINMMIISPKYNLTVELPFSHIDPIFNYCVYTDYEGAGDTNYSTVQFYYLDTAPYEGVANHVSGACSFGGFNLAIPEDEKCEFAFEYNQTSGTPAECWANNPGDTLRMIIWPP